MNNDTEQDSKIQVQNSTATAAEFRILDLGIKLKKVSSTIRISTAVAVEFWTWVLNKYWYLSKVEIQNSTAVAVEFWVLNFGSK